MGAETRNEVTDDFAGLAQPLRLGIGPCGCNMSAGRREVAAHAPRPWLTAVRLSGGPWDGREVWVEDLQALLVLVNGPRHGDHRVWITHLYERRGQCYEFVTTEVVPLSAWTAWDDFRDAP
jgi:hypothetical protein